MKITLAETAGFCWGVQRAVDIVLDVSKKSGKPVFTHGPLIHNNQVLEELESKKIHEYKSGDIGSNTLVVRAHGIRPEVLDELKSKHKNVVDATCPLVTKVHRAIKKHQDQNFQVFIMGNEKHPEVVGLLGASKDRAIVIRDAIAAREYPQTFDKICLVSQTTQNDDDFEATARELKLKCKEFKAVNTICEPTRSHQIEVVDLALNNDLVIVVGGKHSSNTVHLKEVAERQGTRAIHIETEAELKKEDLLGVEKVGVTAGASTPQWMIQKVIDKLESFEEANKSLLYKFSKFILNTLVSTNLFTTTAFASIYLGNHIVSKTPVDYNFFWSVISIVFALHSINQFSLEGKFDRRSKLTPKVYEFVRKLISWFSFLLLFFGVSFGFYSSSIGSDLKGFGIILFSALCGVLYGWKIIPINWISRFGFSSIRDLPASKDLSVSFGWTLLSCGVPLAYSSGNLSPVWFLLIPFIFFIVYIRSAILGVRDAQGDRIVGIESSFKALGKNRSKKLVFSLIGASVLISLCLFLPFFGVSPVFGFLMLTITFVSGIIAHLYFQRILPANDLGHFLLDSQFVLPVFLYGILKLLGYA
ncbi:MAG: 4-hydroxy-3-methylbut-2-enyl diphosphate reductase [Leptospiraceae bacterium]|nr:4-hydroxy-3-methylbut-2-enyl diphosphate reductase [Leptospiraceae bacterium]